jgi:transcriptional regulator, Spx/MgsR family
VAVTLYGIKTCDSVKKAQNWLKQNNITAEFIDFKQTPPTEEQITQWCNSAGWEKLLNKQSKTFRELSPTEKTITDEAQAVALMLTYPLLIKRPVLISQHQILIGFSELAYNALNN